MIKKEEFNKDNFLRNQIVEQNAGRESNLFNKVENSLNRKILYKKIRDLIYEYILSIKEKRSTNSIKSEMELLQIINNLDIVAKNKIENFNEQVNFTILQDNFLNKKSRNNKDISIPENLEHIFAILKNLNAETLEYILDDLNKTKIDNYSSILDCLKTFDKDELQFFTDFIVCLEKKEKIKSYF